MTRPDDQRSSLIFGEFDSNVVRAVTLERLDDKHQLGACAFIATIHGNPDAQVELAGKLNALLDTRARLEKSGKTGAVLWHQAIGDADVNYLISECLDRVVGGAPLAPEMAALDKRMRGATDSVARKINQMGNLHRVERVAWTMLVAGRKPTFQAIARELQVEASTVIRWFSEKEERAKLEEHWRKTYDLLKRGSKLRRR